MRKQPKRVVKPRVYFDLVDYDSDLDDKAVPSSFSPARRRGTGPRFSQGNVTDLHSFPVTEPCDVPLLFVALSLPSVDFVSLDGFLGDISDDEVRHRKSSSHRGPPGRRKPEKVVILSFIYGYV